MASVRKWLAAEITARTETFLKVADGLKESYGSADLGGSEHTQLSKDFDSLLTELSVLRKVARVASGQPADSGDKPLGSR